MDESPEPGVSPVRKILIKANWTTHEQFEIHPTQPLGLVRVYFAGESHESISLNYRRTNLAAETRVEALAADAYLWADRKSNNRAGDNIWWNMDYNLLREALKTDFEGSCELKISQVEHKGHLAKMVYGKQCFNVLHFLPDGRWFTIQRPLWSVAQAKQYIGERFGHMFSGTIQAWAMCACGKHWHQLSDNFTFAFEDNALVIFLPPLQNRLLPYISRPDSIIKLTTHEDISKHGPSQPTNHRDCAVPTQGSVDKSMEPDAAQPLDKMSPSKRKVEEDLADPRSPSRTPSPSTADDANRPSVVYRSGCRQLHVTLPNQKTRLISIRKPLLLRSILEERLPAVSPKQVAWMLGDTLVDQNACVVYDPSLPEAPPRRLYITPLGPGGASEQQVRDKLTSTLKGKGLQDPDLTHKVQETMNVLEKQDLVKFHGSSDPWRTLKQLVGNRITFIKRGQSQGPKDPWLTMDPWREAKNKATSSNTPGVPQVSKTPLSILPLRDAFRNEDGTHPVVLDKLQHGSSGLVMLNPTQFHEWADVPRPISPDEISAIVFPPLGPLDTPKDWNIQTVDFPATLTGTKEMPTLLKGSLCHFGAKTISLEKPSDDKAFQVKDAASVLVEIDKEDSEGEWQNVLVNPLQYVTNRVSPVATVFSHWGARFWTGRSRTPSQSQASRYSVNLLIARTSFHAALRLSGNGLWISPRAGQPEFAKYKPIWVPGTLADLTIKHDKIPDGAGMVKSKKGFAIRVPTSSFEKHRAALLPGVSFPTPSDASNPGHAYKLSPAPLGATKDDVSDFLQHYVSDNHHRVIKQLGPKAWLVSFNDPVKHHYLCTNAGFIILQPWITSSQRDPLHGAIVVGSANVVREAVSHIGLTSQIKGSTVCPVTAVSVAPRPPPEGPIQERLAATEKKFHDLLEAQKAEFHTLLTETKENQASALQEVKDDTKQQLQEIRAEAQNTKQDLQQLITKNQAEATSQTKKIQESMDSGFQQLMQEMRRFRVSEAKRLASPSPDEEPHPKNQRPS
ncbi:unnamed protein product [Symbiodinium sp. CCMP2592]|nr:unnamed protein product [Symbiodinium sp. CCMP2592]